MKSKRTNRNVVLGIAWAGILAAFAGKASYAQSAASVFAASFSSQDANPASLGVSSLSRNQLMVPALPSVSAGYWSDKLALTPFINLNFSDSAKLADYIDVVLDQSFKTGGKDPTDASKKIMNGINSAVSLYVQTSATPVFFATKLGSVAIHSHVDAQLDLPRGIFAAIFGNDQGLIAGNSLDFSKLSAQMVSYSTISLAHGKPFITDAPQRFLSRISGGFFDCSEAAWGVGIDYVMGHALLKEKTLDGSMVASTRNGVDAVSVNGKIETITAGGGLHGRWKTPASMSLGNFFPGNGVGLNAGAIFSGNKTMLGFSLSNIGFIRWSNIKRAVYTLRDSSVQYSRLFSDTVLQIRPGKADTLTGAPVLYQSLPTTAAIAAGYAFHFDKNKRSVRTLSQYLSILVRYDQHLAPWPSYSYVPDVSIDFEDGAVFGIVPIRCSFFAGGLGHWGSSLGGGLRTRYINLNLGYTSFGTLYFYPKRGFSAWFDIMGTWGHRS